MNLQYECHIYFYKNLQEIKNLYYHIAQKRWSVKALLPKDSPQKKGKLIKMQGECKIFDYLILLIFSSKNQQNKSMEIDKIRKFFLLLRIRDKRLKEKHAK